MKKANKELPFLIAITTGTEEDLEVQDPVLIRIRGGSGRDLIVFKNNSK